MFEEIHLQHKVYPQHRIAIAVAASLLLLISTTSPYWLLDLVPVSGETWPIRVRESIPGYEWKAIELEKEVKQHYQGAKVVNGVFRAPDGFDINVFAATWITGKGPDLVFGPHTPDVCYPAQGAVCLEKKSTLYYFEIAGKKVPFGKRIYQLRNGHKVLIYFSNLLGGSTFLQVGDRIWTRFAVALRTRTDKRREQAYLLVTTPVVPSVEMANERLLRFIPAWVDVREKSHETSQMDTSI